MCFLPPLIKYPKELKYSKSDYTYFILALILILIIPLGFFYTQYIIYNKAITIDCKLLNRSFKGSTLETNAVPVVGMGMNGGATVGV